MLKNKMNRLLAVLLMIGLMSSMISFVAKADGESGPPPAPEASAPAEPAGTDEPTAKSRPDETANTAEAESPYVLGNFEETVNGTNLYLVPLHSDAFFFEQKDAKLEQRIADNGALVAAGDPLFTYTCAMSAAPYEEAKLRLERTIMETEEGIIQRQKDIEKLQNSSILNGYDQKIQAIRLEQMEADLTLYDAQQQRLIAQYQEECDLLEEEYETRIYYAEASGIVSYTTMQSKIKGDLIEQETIRIADPSSYRVLVASSNGFRYGMEVTLEFGLKGSRTTVKGRIVAGDNLLMMENVSLGEALSTPINEELYVIDIEGVDLAEVLENPNAFSSPVVSGIRKYEENVWILPRSYMKSENGRFYVTIEENNAQRKQYLQIGGMSVNDIWVISGLSPDDRIQKR